MKQKRRNEVDIPLLRPYALGGTGVLLRCRVHGKDVVHKGLEI